MFNIQVLILMQKDMLGTFDNDQPKIEIEVKGVNGKVEIIDSEKVL